jgi:Fur family ferric uptake transcriptional regulator
MSHKHAEIDIPTMLHEKGFRVTAARVKLLTLLERAGKPLSIQNIVSRWIGKVPNQTTLYRSLTDLCVVGIVRRMDLNTGIAHFEYTPDRPHHHHVVCTECGRIEEIQECSVGALEKKVLRESVQFTKINTHNLEFFGACKECVSV